MRFHRLSVVPFTLLLAGCSDSTAPANRVTAVYVLETIAGQPLPATIARITGGTTTVLWGTLTLDPDGKATIIEHRRNQVGANQQEQTSAGRTDYNLSGTSITIGPPCRDDTPDCYPHRFGQLTETRLTLSAPLGEPEVLYSYRVAAID